MFSVGGGNLEKNISPNLVTALQYAQAVGAKILGVVGRDGGYTAKVADACVLVPTVNPRHITPHTEAFQAVVWHLLVSHPELKASADEMGIGDGVTAVRAVFLDRDGVLNRAIVRDGKPYPPASLAETGNPAGRAARRWQRLKHGRVPADRGHQPARCRARNADAAKTVEEINARICATRCRSTNSWSAITTTRTAATAASRSPGCCWRRRDASASICAQLHGRRPLARYRGRTARRLPDRIHRSRLSTKRSPETSDRLCRSLAGSKRRNCIREGDANMTSVQDLKVKIFADGADKAGMLEMYANPFIKGFTTNPTLMRKAGITDYRAFCPTTSCSSSPTGRFPSRSSPTISTKWSARRGRSPAGARTSTSRFRSPTRGAKPRYDLVRDGSRTRGQAQRDRDDDARPGARRGRRARPAARRPTSRFSPAASPTPAATRSRSWPRRSRLLHVAPATELIWASPRELLNIFQADAIGCHIITVTNDILKKLKLVGNDLDDYSLDTVKMFYDDARSAGFKL